MRENQVEISDPIRIKHNANVILLWYVLRAREEARFLGVRQVFIILEEFGCAAPFLSICCISYMFQMTNRGSV